MKTVRNEDSKQVMALLNESRNMFRNSLEDFKQEQEEYRRQLELITKQKEAAMGRRKGMSMNFISVSLDQSSSSLIRKCHSIVGISSAKTRCRGFG